MVDILGHMTIHRSDGCITHLNILFKGAIVWKALKQPTVTTSTTEAELLGVAHIAKEIMALRRFFKEIELKVEAL
ncbi:hypothetical protein PZA11_007048 [Diplocarpon coronariae]